MLPALDKHIQDGYGDQVAFIYDSPVTQTIRKYTFLEVKPK
jgi:propionyl-CoA synthetase